jgi:hypothetical protein
MNKVQRHINALQQQNELARQLDCEPASRPKQGLAQTPTPRVAFRRAQINRNRPAPADLLALQRTVGNRQVQRQLLSFQSILSVQERGAQVSRIIQRELSKRDEGIKTKVEQFVNDGKHDEALDLICKEYGFTGKNFEIKVVPPIADAWATTGGEIKTGAKQTLSIGKDLFGQDFVFILRTIGHEFQHLKQRSQEKPIENQKEREFLAWGWEALDTSVPTYSLAVAADHAREALKFYAAMPDERKDLSSNKATKKSLEELIKKADAAATPK